MTVVTIDEAKKTLEDVCSKAVDEREPVFIQRHGLVMLQNSIGWRTE